ncbi:hypothetical protein CASFOL_001521 [Castilleja foliolosa]|uniref:Uncharacterized protein n=1 Tax=Castilleja foliolosa TaxID=1961234 RepID=A0ABD3CKM1_9LAMI
MANYFLAFITIFTFFLFIMNFVKIEEIGRGITAVSVSTILPLLIVAWMIECCGNRDRHVE